MLLHCFHQLQRSIKKEKLKSQFFTKVKKTKPWQFHSCPGDAMHGVSGENPCEGREPLRADLSQLPPPRTSTKGGLLQQKIKQTQEKRSVPFIVICCRPCKTPALLTASLTSRNLSRTTSLLFQLHCVFVSLSFFFPFLFFFSFSCLQFASSGLFTIWLLWFLI